VRRIPAGNNRTYSLAEVEIFADLSPMEMDTLAACVPMRTYAAGELLYSPHSPAQALFILKRGRVRIFQLTAEGRALTIAIINPGAIFGEIVLLGQHSYNSYAQALNEAVVCVISRDRVQRLLSDPRIAARVAEALGWRLVEMERRLYDTVFKNAHQRVAATLAALAGDRRRAGAGHRSVQVELTHEQLAALAGISRETATKVLGEFADRGLVRLTRGRVIILDAVSIAAEAGG
jgi:CRP-like cAMP-binding protein